MLPRTRVRNEVLSHGRSEVRAPIGTRDPKSSPLNELFYLLLIFALIVPILVLYLFRTTSLDIQLLVGRLVLYF